MDIISSARIDAMVTQLRAAAARSTESIIPPDTTDAVVPTNKVDFGSLLRTSIDQVNGVQKKAESLGERFLLGDKSTNLGDVMIASQKSSISFQATLQVRNKLISAYHEVMNMAI